ncbi:MAG: hypothetical protein COA51_03300 [Idiomarina sp.]|nr:MAG: hypothetical protein COA51_03300 [Idiomarina sp.]
MSLLADWQLNGPLLALWPFRNDVWRDNGEPAQRQLLQLAERLQPYQNIVIGVHPDQYDAVQQRISNQFSLFSMKYDDAWPRDIGPLWARSDTQTLVAHGFKFSAWHGLYPNFHDDQLFAERLAHQLNVTYRAHDLVFEGGAISTDGAGTAVIHGVSVIRNNPTWSALDIETYLKAELQITHLYWLHFAHPADETGGHADNQVQFLDANTIVVSLPNTASSLTDDYIQQLEVARRWTNAKGELFKVIVVPQPEAITPVLSEYQSIREQAGVLPRGKAPLLASYVNFVRTGNVVLVPQFGLDTDAEALAILRRSAPQLTIIGAAADEFIKAGGALHCMTLPTP